jgi:CRISPR system Cascade subunit CasB
MKEKQEHPFIAFLKILAEDRGALAALRRGLGKPPGAAPEMFPYVVPHLPERVNRQDEAVYYLIASLYAYHPADISQGNLGTHMAGCIQGDAGRQAIERRFVALLSAHTDDLGEYLRHVISFLRSREHSVNWSQLLRDLCAWDHPDRYVQRNWARDFWGRPENPPTLLEKEPAEDVEIKK